MRYQSRPHRTDPRSDRAFSPPAILWKLGTGAPWRDQPERYGTWNIETADVKAEFDRHAAAGATVVREPYQFDGEPNTRIATLADPDDNYFQLMTPMGPPQG